MTKLQQLEQSLQQSLDAIRFARKTMVDFGLQSEEAVKAVNNAVEAVKSTAVLIDTINS
jgi:TPP-dependent pyruvate/acetoin dehydrogenase alpha subunit